MANTNQYPHGHYSQTVVRDEVDFTNKKSANLFIAKVFGLMGLGILYTAIIAVVVAFTFAYLLNTNSNTETITNGLLIALVVSAIGLLIMSFVLPIKFARNRKSILPAAIIYMTFMGILFSTFVLFINWEILAVSLGVTALIFTIMGGLGYITKGSINGFLLTISTLFVGALILSLVNFIVYFISPETYTSIYWITSFIIFGIIMLATVVDVYRIKQIAQNGEASKNLTIYCAFVIYTDFISILVRVIYYVALIYSRNK